MAWHVIRVRSKDAQKQLARTSLNANSRLFPRLPFAKTIRLEISGINIKQLNARLREREPLENISTSARENSKSRKIASPHITAHIFWSFPNGMVRTIWFSNWNFRFSRVNGKYPSSFFASQILFHLVVSADCELNLMIPACVLTQFSPEFS